MSFTHNFRVLAYVGLIATVTIIVSGCSDPVTPILSSELGDLAGKDLISKFEDSGNRLLADAAQSGNILEANAGERIEVATQNLALVLSDQQDKLAKTLNDDEQKLILSVNDIVQAGQKISNTATTVEELTNLDLIQESNRINLLTKKQEFYVSSINGLTSVPGEGDHILTIRGIGFGYDSSTNLYEVSASFNGTPLDPGALSRPDNHTLSVRIPGQLLATLYQSSSMRRVQFDLYTIVRDAKHPNSNGHPYHAHFGILLMPQIGGTISITEEIADHHLDGQTKTHDISVSVPKSSTDHPFEYQGTWSCAANERIIGCTYEASGAGARWCYNKRQGGVGIDYSVSDNGTTIRVYRHCDGEAAEIIHHVQYQTMTTSYTMASPRSQTISLGLPVFIVLNDADERHSFTITGKTITGQSIFVDSNTLTNPDNVLKLVGAGPIEGHYRLDFNFRLP